jgi:hypothetical protein
MSNTRRPAEAVPFEEHIEGHDCGLGYCYSCLSDYYATRQATRPPDEPRFAITYAPAAVPGPAGGLFLIPLPSCWYHLIPNPAAAARNGSRLALPPH